ncbi:MAG: hypothetical protein ACP5PS_00750 [Bacteroidales bacterium]
MPKPFMILSFIALLLATGCSVQQNYLTGSHCNSKCTYLRMGIGRAQAVSIWGIGNQKMEGLVFAAKNNLYRAFPLHKAEFYDNFVVSIRNTYFPFVKKTVVTLYADIVTEDEADNERPFSSSYYEYLGHPQSNRWGIELSDSVVFTKGGKLWKGVVIELTGRKATVMMSQNGIERFIHLPIKRIFALENEKLEEECDCEAGEVLEVLTTAGREPRIVKIVGLQRGRKLIAITQKNKTRYHIATFAK